MELTAEPCSPVRVEHAEGPFWYGDRFGWVDIMAAHLWVAGFDGVSLTEPRSYDVGRPLGAAVPRTGGGWTLAAGTGFFGLDEDGTVERLTEDLADSSAVRMNDGKCDPAGRFWAGTMDYDESHPRGSLYVFDGTARTVLEGVTISNGLAWSPDRRTMYYIDTPTGRVDTFTYDEADGTIKDRRPFVEVEGGHPDGMTLDDEGFLWVALWGGGAVRRYDPAGRPAGVVHLPVTNVSSCCFAGTTLLITTSQQGLSAERRAAEPDAGRIFKAETGVSGPHTTPFG
ncbi:SMP-30/gluconolactonase/LRE family protein [Actinomadura sp. DC4]|uniref:SMP-30/gluconolactonase/LRE family protein n=1 Tax=Actinomadura sp. DC4 TaxID=3055069 RepID=UPI0025AF04DC|nr:SMP-30/gluconolactonase/LRE family protein [Actinomadura sp. DC4]MDN3357401.1 SMP-30/gluconolactonase/LRE family protein [Actinomadura sp. DC4]